jgi:CheY-like chemotaxis protein
VFIVEDHPVTVEGLRVVLGAWVVGTYPEDSAAPTPPQPVDPEDLAARIAAARANIVLMDLSLKRLRFPAGLPQFEGLWLISELRRECSVKIIAFSQYAQHRTRALDHGAHRFVDKDGALADLRAAILDVFHNGDPPPPPGDILTGLELRRARREIVLFASDSPYPPVPLEACPFAFLSYLAKEWQARRKDALQPQAGSYRLTDAEAWRRLCQEAECAWGGQPVIPRPNLSLWVHRINASVEPMRPPRAPRLVDQSGRRRRYVLNPSIAPERIAFSE